MDYYTKTNKEGTLIKLGGGGHLFTMHNFFFDQFQRTEIQIF